MVSLTTVYVLSVILTSIAGMGSAFAGNKMIGGVKLQTSEQPQPNEIDPEQLPEQIANLNIDQAR